MSSFYLKKKLRRLQLKQQRGKPCLQQQNQLVWIIILLIEENSLSN